MRDSLVPVVVALLCVLALGVGAAGLQELTDDADSGPPEVEGDGGESSEEPAQESQASGNDPQRLALDGDTSDACIAGYNQNDLAMLTVVLAIGVSLVATLLTREIMVGAAVLPMVFIPAFVVMLFVFAFLDCPVPAQEAVTNVQNLTGTQNVSGGGNVTAPDNTDSTWGNLRIYGIFGALIVSVFAMALYVQRRNSGDVADARNYQVDAA